MLTTKVVNFWEPCKIFQISDGKFDEKNLKVENYEIKNV